MKRGFIGTLGAAIAVTVVTLGVTTLDRATAQEAPERPRAPRPEAVSIVSALGSGSYLGVQVADVDAEFADEIGLSDVRGVRIREVVEDGPAADAGLAEDDVIVSWNGARLESLAQLQRHLRETPPGRTVQLGIHRGGRELTIGVELGDRSDRMTYAVAPRARLEGPRMLGVEPGRMRVGNVFVGRGRMGVSIMSLSDQLADYFGVDGGALITSVLENTPAERAGLRAGDVIIGIDDDQIEDPGDVSRALSGHDAGPVTVRVVRDGQERSLTVELEERQSSAFCEGDECEEWAQDWSRSWEEWAEGFSDRWEHWAQENEGVWEEWGRRWEEWAEEWADEWENSWRFHGGDVHIEGGDVHIEPIHIRGVDIGSLLSDLPMLDLPAITIPEIHLPDVVVPEVRGPGDAAVVSTSFDI